MHKKPLISIITASYNSEKTIRAAIESVLGQTYSKIEYIIADGGSTDRTVGIAEEYIPAFRKRGYRYEIISGRDGGIYSGMNKGISAAHGEVIGMVNSDDYYEDKAVEIAARAYAKTGFDLFYSDVVIFNGIGGRPLIKHARRMRHYYSTRFWNHPTTFIPKRIYDKRMYQESYRYYADWEMVLWIYRHYKKIAVVNIPVSNFRIGGETAGGNIGKCASKIKERYRAYRDNGFSRLYLLECIGMDFFKDMLLYAWIRRQAGKKAS